MKTLRRKPVQVVMVLLLTAAIILSGTFAWNSFNQSRINVFKELITPDTNLHDDFAGGPNKDVYVENSGTATIFVRVRLTEYLQTDARGSMVAGHLRDDDKAQWWAPHNALNHTDGTVAIDDCKLIASDKTDPNWVMDGTAETFHDYYTWLMGGANDTTGEIYYKPATTEQKGEYNEDGTTIREPQVVSDPLTETSPLGDAHLEYKAQVDELIAQGKTEAEALEELGLAKTLTSSVITMSQWKTGIGDIQPYATGDFWVIDETDGWCYWANPLEGGNATGLLLDKVTRTEKNFDSNAEYCINAWLQAVDKNDMGQFDVSGNGGITNDGKRLMQIATGSVTFTEDGLYQDNGDGTFTKLEEKDGTPVTDAKTFIGLGVTADGSPAGATAAAANRLEIGARVNLTELVWDGTDYEGYDNSGTAPWHNLVTNESGTYIVSGIIKGTDGNQYLKLDTVDADGIAIAGTSTYIGSVVRSGEASPYTYKQSSPGAGPFAIIYPNSTTGQITGSDDSRLPPNVTIDNHFFYHLGNGMYVEVSADGETEPIKSNESDSDITYFFAGTTLTSSKISGATGSVDEKITNLFPVQIKRGAEFGVTFGAADENGLVSVTAYYASGSGYTMTDPVKGLDGNYYIYLGSDEEGYISVGSDNFLGNAGDTRRWAGKFGIGGNDDPEKAPEYFSEGFLAGKKKADLDVGGTITVDGADWMVLDIDKYGNRFMLRTSLAVSATMSDIYAISPASTAMKNFYNTGMPTLKPYVMDASTPVESGTFSTTRNEPAAISSALSTKSNPTVFALSQSEWITYSVSSKQIHGSGGVLRTRSPSRSGYSVAMWIGSGKTATPRELAHSTNCGTVAGGWFRFSDADKIATATEEERSIWESIPTRGSVITFGNYPQNQKAATPVQPVEWVVLEIEDTKALVMSKKLITSDKLSAGNLYTQYKDSPARTQLNSTFYNAAFSTSEKAMILDTEVVTPGLTTVTDKLFLPSFEEADKYSRLYAHANVVAAATTYAKNYNSYLSPHLDWYWLRTPSNQSSGKGVLYRTGLGFYYLGDTNRPIGLRPMMWIDYSK